MKAADVNVRAMAVRDDDLFQRSVVQLEQGTIIVRFQDFHRLVPITWWRAPPLSIYVDADGRTCRPAHPDRDRDQGK